MLLLFLVTGCSGALPAIDNLKQEKGFVHAEIAAGKMGIGGIVSDLGSLSVEDRVRYAGLLRKALQDEKKDYAVFPAGELERRMGPDCYRDMLDAYRKLGFLCQDTLLEIRAAAGGFRYLVWARIEADKTSEKTVRRPQTDDQGREIEGERWVELSTGRAVVVSFDIYDLVNAASVMSGSLWERMDKSWAYGETEGKGVAEGFFQGLTSVFVQATAEGLLQPSAPPLDKVLFKIFKRLARGIP